MSTIYHLLERHHVTGDVSDRRRSGRPRVMSVHQDPFILLMHLQNRFQSAAATSRERRGLNNWWISIDTVCRHLRNAGLRARRPYCDPRLTWGNAYAGAGTILNWCLRDWHDMLFSDHTGGPFSVFRRTGERYADACVMERDRWGEANIMVWGDITYSEQTQLVLNFQDNGPRCGLTAGRCIDQVLRPYVVTFFAQHPWVSFPARLCVGSQCFSYSELSSSQWNSCTGLASPLPRSRSHRASLGRVGETYQ